MSYINVLNNYLDYKTNYFESFTEFIDIGISCIYKGQFNRRNV